ALWTAARPMLADLRVHRTGVNRIVRRRGHWRRWRTRVTLRIGDELLAAAGAAKPVRRADVLGGAARRVVRIYIHAAHRIFDSARSGRVVTSAVGHASFLLLSHGDNEAGLHGHE